jgi:murein DD-endopeptidase MepM/ murein hydrolase activator NlpD
MKSARLAPVFVAAAILGLTTSSASSVSGTASRNASTLAEVSSPRIAAISAGLSVAAGEMTGTQQRLDAVGRRVQQLRESVDAARRGMARSQRMLEVQMEAAGAAIQESPTTLPAPATDAPATDTSTADASPDGSSAPSPGVSPAGTDADRTLKTRDRLTNGFRAFQARIASLHADVGELNRQLVSIRTELARHDHVVSDLMSRIRSEKLRQRAPPGWDGASETSEAQHLFAQVTALRRDADRHLAQLAGLRGQLGSQERGSADDLAEQAVREVIGVGDGAFLLCPVDQPRSFSDDFGFPRWAGGFHTHQGNDIFAPLGTPVRAPFDGDAVSSANTLGGEAVKVFGVQGWVYNAHLSAYGKLGQVKAGTIIGYVGNTGDAAGGPTHDHFEWHPGGGPAVNPFPFLQKVC